MEKRERREGASEAEEGEEGGVLIAGKDTGTGIDPELIPKGYLQSLLQNHIGEQDWDYSYQKVL